MQCKNNCKDIKQVTVLFPGEAAQDTLKAAAEQQRQEEINNRSVSKPRTCRACKKPMLGHKLGQCVNSSDQ
eukprot:Seg10982.1 transcript_id=Seg10982.1/GoldUCD/mRNA.D3Y31 product="hypothetical protein" protein_id=Seg10982.1/GoldUCD/D3Y31